MYISIPLEDVQSLLRSPALAEVQEDVVRKIGSRILSEHAATPFQRELSYAGIPADAIHDLLQNERELLVRFATICQLASGSGDADGEFPPGEEPDPEDRSETVAVLGHSNGFIIHHGIMLLLARRGSADLMTFLKWRRIPFAARYRRELLNHYQNALGSE